MTRTHHSAQGFSLLELMVSTVVMLIVAGGAFGALNYYQKTYQHTEIGADMHDNLRSAIDLIMQEAGQAGALPSGTLGTVTLSASVLASGVAQTVNVNNTTGFIAGEQIYVDAGPTQEFVTLKAVGAGTVTAIFGQNHNAGAQLNAIGVFPAGILPTSTTTSLKIFGDINGDGTIVYVEYNCNYVAGGVGTLTRSVTPVGTGAVNPATALVDNLLPNPAPDGPNCFQYPVAPPVVAGFTFINQVGVTLTVQSTTKDVLTGSFETMTKSATDIVPRNIQMGLDLANAGLTTRLQSTTSTMP